VSIIRFLIILISFVISYRFQVVAVTLEEDQVFRKKLLANQIFSATNWRLIRYRTSYTFFSKDCVENSRKISDVFITLNNFQDNLLKKHNK
jgi:hypothetical protein